MDKSEKLATLGTQDEEIFPHNKNQSESPKSDHHFMKPLIYQLNGFNILFLLVVNLLTVDSFYCMYTMNLMTFYCNLCLIFGYLLIVLLLLHFKTCFL